MYVSSQKQSRLRRRHLFKPEGKELVNTASMNKKNGQTRCLPLFVRAAPILNNWWEVITGIGHESESTEIRRSFPIACRKYFGSSLHNKRACMRNLKWPSHKGRNRNKGNRCGGWPQTRPFGAACSVPSVCQPFHG